MNCKPLTHCALSLALISILGCPADDDAGGGETEGTGTESSTDASASGATLTSTTASTQTTTAGTTTTSSETEGSTTEDPSTTEPATSGETDTTGATDDTGGSTTGGEEVGVCVQGCEEDVDCCPLGSIACPGKEYPNNYTCNEGICEFGGCDENADCEGILADDECHPIDGIGTCFDPCVNDDDCINSQCIGVADDGSMYCTTETEPCEEDEDCGDLGRCNADEGTCYCESSKQCTDLTLDTCSTDP